LTVPVISLYEVHKKFLSVGESEKANVAVDIMQNAAVSGITPELAIRAAQLSKQHKLPLADSIIYATAVSQNADLYTQDIHFQNLDRVHYYPK